MTQRLDLSLSLPEGDGASLSGIGGTPRKWERIKLICPLKWIILVTDASVRHRKNLAAQNKDPCHLLMDAGDASILAPQFMRLIKWATHSAHLFGIDTCIDNKPLPRAKHMCMASLLRAQVRLQIGFYTHTHAIKYAWQNACPSRTRLGFDSRSDFPKCHWSQESRSELPLARTDLCLHTLCTNLKDGPHFRF